MKRIAIIFAAFVCSMSLTAQTVEDDAAWKLKADTVRALKHYQGRRQLVYRYSRGCQPLLIRERPFRLFR